MAHAKETAVSVYQLVGYGVCQPKNETLAFCVGIFQDVTKSNISATFRTEKFFLGFGSGCT